MVCFPLSETDCLVLKMRCFLLPTTDVLFGVMKGMGWFSLPERSCFLWYWDGLYNYTGDILLSFSVEVFFLYLWMCFVYFIGEVL
jgi:hypothetical protein